MKTIFRSLSAASLAAFAIGFSGGCQREAPEKGFDASEILSKVSPGMSEIQVVSSVGAPNKIEVEGEYRHLRYKVANGTLIVTLRNNVVTDVVQRD